MDEETMLRESPVIEKSGAAKGKKSFRNWKDVTIGGVSGILVGSAGVVAAQAFPKDHPADADEIVHDAEVVEERGEIAVATSVNDDMSFRQAIDAAREEVGPGGAFAWHGNVYSTYRADDPEWIEMGTEGQKAHCREIVEQVQAEPYFVEQESLEEPVEDFIDEPDEEPEDEVVEESDFEEPTFEEPTFDEPADEPADEPVEEEIEEQVVEESEEEPEEEPEVESEEAPEEELVAELVQEPEEAPVEELEEEPVEEPVVVPAEEPVEESVEEPVEEPVAEPAEKPEEEPVEEPAAAPAKENLGRPTIEQIIKLYKASVPLVKPEPEPEIKIVSVEENGEESAVQPEEVKASNDVTADPDGGVKVDIFSEVRGIVDEEDNGLDEVGPADL